VAELDTELRTLVVQKEFFDKNPSAGKMAMAADETFYVAVKFTGDVSELQKAGLKVGEVAVGFAFGAINLAGLEKLARLQQVESIRKQRRVHAGLDDSVPDIKADQLWSRSGDHFTGYTGKDVIVGIVDSGIDFRHAVFRGADGQTRIHKIWDQTLTPQAGETVPGPITRASLLSTPGTPIPLGYGVEYDAGQIKAAINNSGAIKARQIDEGGHGTHVAGIAAGDGSQSGGCHLAYHYVGVATDATLIVVRMWGLSKSDAKTSPTNTSVTLDAFRYILNEAQKLGKPVVINFSNWSFTEEMGGQSFDSFALDKLLTDNSTGTAMVIITGNGANKNFHAAATVPAGPAAILELKFKVADGDTKARHLTVLYSGSNLQVQLTSKVSGAGGVISWVSSGNNQVSTTANGSNGLVTISNQLNRIDIAITPPPAPASGPKPTNVDGTWKLEFRDSTSTATAIDAFCLYGSHDGKTHRFLDHLSPRTTLSPYASGKEIVSVGSYRLGGVFHGIKLSESSSRGPTTDSPPRSKPDICAPGEDITSAGLATDRTGCKSCCCECCQDFYVDMSGTSMSAPHITGVIALMLHKNPNLTHTEIKNLLTANFAAKPGDSTPDEDVGWGAGRVDAKKTVDVVTQVNPPVSKVAVPQTDALGALQEQLRATARGAELAGLFDKHGDEVMALINRNKRVATVWHRCRGPVWVRLALRAAHTPHIRVPFEADGLSLQESAHRFGEILKRYASAAFRQDLQRYQADLGMISDGMTLQEMIEAVGNRAGVPA